MKIILVETEKSGNLGAVARVMSNFGFKDLVLVNPKCRKQSQEARNRAKHAQDILKKARVVKSIPRLHTLIATTAQLGTDYNIPRCPISPEQLKEMIASKPDLWGKIGLVFGPEGEGLSNKEISKCDFVVTIPTNKQYPVLNLSHSVAIVLYELSKVITDGKDGNENVSSHIIPASELDKKQIMKLLNRAIKKIDFCTAQKRETQRIVWKRVVSKSFLTKREAFALMGFLRKCC